MGLFRLQVPNELQWTDQPCGQPSSHWCWSIGPDVLTYPDTLGAAPLGCGTLPHVMSVAVTSEKEVPQLL